MGLSGSNMEAEGQVKQTIPDFQRDSRRATAADESSSAAPWRPSRGLLRMSRFEAGRSASSASSHRSTFVNGPDYCGMKDNDLRGYLDGGFIWGWNQATQIHVRLGRTDEFPNPRYGEAELFRVVQRWDDIMLPAGSEISGCRLTLHVEEGPTRFLRLLVYAVARDWNPGSGGVDSNNVSVPKPGEVWWGDAAYGEAAWGLPGAGFASDSHPEADTDAQALAETQWVPGQDQLVFQSEALARYAFERVSQRQPILLLLKLTDAQEDLPGHFLNLYSGEHGDSRNTARRPRLELEWSNSSEVESEAHDIFLEYGRMCELPRQESGGGMWTASFDAGAGSEQLTVQVREGTGEDAGPWHTIALPFEPGGEWFQLRLLAMPDPIELGSQFEAELADTWVLTGPPEQQHVPWRFESPSGAVHSIAAEYMGRYRWRIRFTPDEVGTWRYLWTQDFLSQPYRSATGEFRVWGGCLQEILRGLDRLEEAAAGSAREDRSTLYLRLYALEREGMRLLEPAEYRGADGERFQAMVRRVRSSLWGRPVPNPIPMLSHRLVSQFKGAELRDPILDAGGYRERERRSAHHKQTPLRRLRRRLRRLGFSREEPDAGHSE
jgi:hypothetical protein